MVKGARRSAPFTASDVGLVIGGALALAVFEGPVSLRKLRAILAGVPSDVSLPKLIAGRVVWTAALVPLLLVLWRLGARELERRRGVAVRTALAAEALPYAPFVVLVAGLLPGWGDAVPEAWSFAMLFVFLGAVAASTALRVATWHAAFAASPARLRRNLAVFASCGPLLVLATGLAQPFAVQPHWSTLADRSPYWPTPPYVALWTAWVTWLALPILTIPGALLRARRATAARFAAVTLGAVVVALASLVATVDRARWDARAVEARYVAGEAGEAVIAGTAFGGRVVPVPGAARWSWGNDAGEGRAPVRLHAQIEVATLPEAGFWYRCPRAVALEAHATTDGVTSVIGAWILDPRRFAADRGVHTLERELTVLPGRSLTVELATSTALSAGPALPILARVTLRPTR